MAKPHPQLAVFKNCPKCGSDSVRAGEKSIKCDSCGLDYFLNPAAAVGAIIEDPSGRILFLRRAKNPSKDKLGLPGGFVDAFETAEDALRREIMEEVGLDIPSFCYLGAWPNIYPYAGVDYATLDFYYLAKVDSLESATPLDETESCVFLRPEEADPSEFAFDSVRNAIAAYLSSRCRS